VSSGPGAPRCLLVCSVDPWPETSGQRRRISQVAQAIAKRMPVDLVAPAVAARLPAGIDHRLALPPRRQRHQALAWLSWSTSGEPFQVCIASVRDQARAVRGLDLGDYSLIWCHRAENLRLLPRGPLPALVIDLDDLESSKRRLHAAAIGTARAGLRDAARGWFVRADSRRHQRLHDEAARRASALTLANPDDLTGLAKAHLVRNGYPVPTDLDVGNRLGRIPRVVLFVGLLSYGPNASAARTLARVAPRLAEHSPDLEVRIVGSHVSALGDLAGAAHVTLVGEVADLGPELERADVVMTPIPYGGGTRIKLLEAMAHGIPVVSSAIGAAGLGLVPGHHFLCADDDEQLLEAWARLRRDWGPRVEQMVGAAHTHVRERFSFPAVCRDVDAVLAAVRCPPARPACGRRSAGYGDRSIRPAARPP
jgi:glycosyltransferase involved in cell wall biosynthesis